ncbi:hypothetical protein N7488_005049 [Penicillium malachiteum]|nr:hypothetical protein N7488_005049 [Penicillium malachiteum]
MPSEPLDFDTWFENDEYIGSEVSFPCGSIWKLETKIHEYAYQHTQYDWESIRVTSEARGVLTCSKLSEDGPSAAIIKIRLQKDQQTWDELVPGGYKLFILMEKLPGSPDAADLFFTAKRRDSRLERDDLRKAFKAAWLETVRCGVVHTDDAIRNLIWDKENKKCYIVDWELWDSPQEGNTVWTDDVYIGFNLAQVGPSRNYDDMSYWIL